MPPKHNDQNDEVPPKDKFDAQAAEYEKAHDHDGEQGHAKSATQHQVKPHSVHN